VLDSLPDIFARDLLSVDFNFFGSYDGCRIVIRVLEAERTDTRSAFILLSIQGRRVHEASVCIKFEADETKKCLIQF
jgi:hypothetical protein